MKISQISRRRVLAAGPSDGRPEGGVTGMKPSCVAASTRLGAMVRRWIRCASMLKLEGPWSLGIGDGRAFSLMTSNNAFFEALHFSVK
jgi:hypothetical protein